MNDLHYQGEPCIHGHAGIRYRSTNNCVECMQSPHTRRLFAAYKKTEAYREARRRYNQTPAGKEACRINNIKQRCRRLGRVYEAHETPFPKNGRCPYCNVKMGSGMTMPTLDHTIGLGAGGDHKPNNTKWICLSCNKTKGTRPLAYLLSKLNESGLR